MKNSEVVTHAAQFLVSRRITFERLEGIVEDSQGFAEVIFSAPGASDPAVAVADPPDVRVRVFTSTGRCELIEQM